MARRRYRGSRPYNSRRSGAGMERALQHIEEARRLTLELGGADQDVKRYFFSLPPNELRAILDSYGQRYGHPAREYAEQTLPKWRSGRVKMGGQNASRLFNLLPPRMPLSAKYQLTENLWRHVGPSSKKSLRVGINADVEDAIKAVREHIEQVVIDYRIPDNLARRFEWLSAGDVGVKQDLLNHLRQMEKALVVEGARAKLPVLLEHLRNDTSRHTRRLAEVLKVGKHELEVVLDPASSGVKLEQSSSGTSRIVQSSSNGWIVFVIIVAILLILLLARH
jgi:hypothetical protein